MIQLIGLLFVVALVAGMIIYTSMSWGYVCFKFWYWFILPVFPTMPHIAFWQAVGLFLFMGLFKNHGTYHGEKKEGNETAVGLLTPWLVLLIGYMMFLWFIN